MPQFDDAAIEVAALEKSEAEYVAEAATAMERICALETRCATYDKLFYNAFGKSWVETISQKE